MAPGDAAIYLMHIAVAFFAVVTTWINIDELRAEGHVSVSGVLINSLLWTVLAAMSGWFDA